MSRRRGQGLRERASLLVAAAALLPLVVLGALSITFAYRAVLDQVVRADHDVGKRAGAQIAAHVAKYEEVLRRLAATLSPPLHLTAGQSERILRAHHLDVPDLRQIDLVDEHGIELATTRADGLLRDRSGDEAVRMALAGRSYRSRVSIAEGDLVPELVLAEPQRAAGEIVGAVVARIDLSEMWTVIDGLTVGKTGYARVVGEDGQLLAVGASHLKQRVFTQEKDTSGPVVRAVLSGEEKDTTYIGPDGRRLLAVARPIAELGWGLILEHPLREALAPFYRFTSLILALSLVLLFAAALVGGRGARSIVEPIERLRLRAGEIARGLLDARVEVASPEELHALADAMNQMCEDLLRLQDDVRKRERIATLGRMAAGLAHDLKHPVRALQAAAKSVLERPEDPRARAAFGVTVERELRRMNSFLDDLKRVSRNEPMNIVREPFDLADLVRTFVEEQRGTAPSGIVLDLRADSVAPVLGNRDLLGRVLSNLASNAYEAMEGEGLLSVEVTLDAGSAVLSVRDTGKGMTREQLAGLWNEFATTKSRGLGLGLAVSRKIIEDHGGRVEVESAFGEGALFVIRLPLVPPEASALPAGDSGETEGDAG